jgi:hypothetical protein
VAERHQQRSEKDRVRQRFGRVLEAVAIGIERRQRSPQGLTRALLQLRRNRFEEAPLGEHPECALGRAGAQHLVDFLDQPRRRALGDLMAVSGDGGVDRRIDIEIEPRRHRDGAQHPHWIFLEALDRVADAANQAPFEVPEAAGVIDD